MIHNYNDVNFKLIYFNDPYYIETGHILVHIHTVQTIIDCIFHRKYDRTQLSHNTSLIVVFFKKHVIATDMCLSIDLCMAGTSFFFIFIFFIFKFIYELYNPNQFSFSMAHCTYALYLRQYRNRRVFWSTILLTTYIYSYMMRIPFPIYIYTI